MKLTCREVTELLIDFIDGALSEPEMRTLECRISACPPCLSYLETYRTTIAISRALPAEPLPPEFEARLRAVLQAWSSEKSQ